MRISAHYWNLPIKHKLWLIIMFVVSVSLLLVCGAVMTYDQIASRGEMRDDLGVLAEMVGSNNN